ncbi:MAG: MarR family winged helix-turn-helix transcriptional regulator [Ferrovibrio sp.]|uniref:MarR family winged helix-turn-helix transcriptional regulator n=1 Tax=Ferrovibrio sp. TaxID=1917215 RepID=UPI00391A287C
MSVTKLGADLSSPSLFKLLRVTEKCRDALDFMEAQTLQCLLLIATNPGIRQSDLVEKTGLAPSTISRNIAMLSKVFKPGTPGLDFVRAFEDPSYRRTKLVELTPKGQRFVAELIKLMEG